MYKKNKDNLLQGTTIALKRLNELSGSLTSERVFSDPIKLPDYLLKEFTDAHMRNIDNEAVKFYNEHQKLCDEFTVTADTLYKKLRTVDANGEANE